MRLPLVEADVSTLHLRLRAAEAVAALQHHAGTQDIGQLFFRPLTEDSGAMTLVACGAAPPDIKSHLTWTPLATLKAVRSGSACVLRVLCVRARAQRFAFRSQIARQARTLTATTLLCCFPLCVCACVGSLSFCAHP